MSDTVDDRLPDRPGDDDPGRGRRIGIDVGTVRIGVASCDPDGILATPVETVQRDKRDRSGRHLRRLVTLIGEYEAVEVVVGLPRTLADRAGSSAVDAIDWPMCWPAESPRYRCDWPTSGSLLFRLSGRCVKRESGQRDRRR